MSKVNKDLIKLTKEKKEVEKKLSYYKDRLERISELIQEVNVECYYVYIVVVDGEPRYVGKGKGERYKHAISGTSSVAELNRDFFNDSHIDVRIFHGITNMTEEDAFRLEKDVIGSLMHYYTLYNRTLPKTDEYSYFDLDQDDDFRMVANNKNYDFYTRLKHSRYE